jgi:hypothetical protein
MFRIKLLKNFHEPFKKTIFIPQRVRNIVCIDDLMQ